MGEWDKKIGMADPHGTVVRVSYSPDDDEGDAMVFIAVTSGAAVISATPTPEALRQLAATLLDGADALDPASV